MSFFQIFCNISPIHELSGLAIAAHFSLLTAVGQTQGLV